MRSLLPLLGALTVGCGTGVVQVPADAPTGPAPVLLARHPELLTAIELPTDSREGAPVPDRIPVRGPFSLRRTTGGVHSFEAALPIRLRSLFFIRPPDGMSLHRAGDDGPHRFQRSSRQNPRDATWSFAARTIQLHHEADQPPQAGDFELVYARASERERELNRAFSEHVSDADFVLRSAWQQHTDRHGALLPAPATATWSVTVPPRGALAMELGMLEPEVADLAPSDGAALAIQVAGPGAEPRLVERFELEPGVFDTVRVDLSAWAGQQVELSLVSEPGASARYDYVFVGEPTLYTPQADPPRVVLVFIDTLRRDHLELYGYERDTMPRLVEWSQDATVFDTARTPAPWTLPSARALLLGSQPEYWGVRPSLPERLGAEGWASAAFVGNVYLSANFEMADGWSHHFVENWPRANDQVDRLEAWLAEHDDQPAVVMLHLMDTHVPYTEPRKYRKLWAGATPEGLSGSFLRTDVLTAAKGKDKERARQYIIDRYDGAIRYADDQIARVLDTLGPQDIAVVFSDHGEEFWDHNGFEHGHTLYEELLAVPLVIRAPGLAPGRVPQTVSLIDLAPTVYELLGVAAAEGVSGMSLVPLAGGDPAVAEAFDDRLNGFGRPLYGDEQWGVLEGELKYATKAGKEHIFDLGADPGEQDDLVRGDGAGMLDARRTALGLSLDRRSELGFRLRPERDSGKKPLEVTLDVPGGVAAAWVGSDPTEKSAAAVCIEGSTVRAAWEGGHSGTREVFVVPSLPAHEVVPGLVLEASRGDKRATETWDAETTPPRADGRSRRLLRTKVTNARVVLSYAVAPEPPSDGRELGGYDGETSAALEALGYLEGGAPSHEGDENEDWMPVCGEPAEAAEPTPTVDDGQPS
jgi:arylsulfatase A-like enzyme